MVDLAYADALSEDYDYDVQIPKYITDVIGDIGGFGNHHIGYLGEFDYTFMSGWMYSVNNSFPNIGAADYFLEDGDVIRWQYTIYGYGADLNVGLDWGVPSIAPQAGNKDNLIKAMASGKFSLETPEYYQALYVLTNPLATQEDIDNALQGVEGMYFSSEEIFSLAEHYLWSLNGIDNTVVREKRPLYDEDGELFVYAVPFEDNSGDLAGHVNVGALRDGLTFYIIVPFPYNYSQIKRYTDSGEQVRYSLPFAYYIETGEDSSNIKKSEKSKDEKLYKIKNYRESNEKLLEYIKEQKKTLLDSSANHTVAELKSEKESSENNKRYVKIYDKSICSYGGQQEWWENTKGFVSKTGRTEEYLDAKGCGAVAFTDVIMYHIGKDYDGFGDLLKYTDMNRIGELPNPDYIKENFTETFDYDSRDKSFTKDEYLKFLDFYADFAQIPNPWGVLPSEMKVAFYSLKSITEFDYTLYEPSSKNPDNVEMFFIEQLNADIPILMFNGLEPFVETRYLINDLSKVTNLILLWIRNLDYIG